MTATRPVMVTTAGLRCGRQSPAVAIRTCAASARPWETRPIGEPLATRRIGLGRFHYETTSAPRTFIVRVSGIDGPMLLKDSLAKAEAFGEAHPEGWVWITDLRRLIWTSPRSFLYVRGIRKLPGNRGYAVIARQPFRLLGAIAGRAFGAERFVATPDQALEFAASRL